MNIDEIIKMISFKIESDKTAYVWINKENARKLLKEIERLNKIIDELEKWLMEDVKDEKPDLYFQVLRKIDIIDKIKELKGGDE